MNESSIFEENLNISIKERKYKIGTCYVCQKCLYCGVNLTEESGCNCDKPLKPTNNSKTKKLQVGYVRNGIYNPNTSHPILITLLQSSNDIYKYCSDFSKKFNFTLCAKCNSQLIRDQNVYNKNNCISIDEKKNQISKTSTKSLNNPSKLNDISKSDIPFQFKLVIKTPDSTKPAKAITLEKKLDYYEFDDLVLQKVCEAAGLLVRAEYELSYKTDKGAGAGTVLEEEDDYEEFIREYHRLTNSDKVLLITVTIKKKEKTKRKKKSLEISDDDKSTDEENESELTSKKKNKKKSRVPKENNLADTELIKGEIHKKLKEMHECSIHKTGYCYIRDDRHLMLTTLHLSMWTDEIYKNNCNYETPPPHPNFGMANSLKVSTTRSSSPSSSISDNNTNYYPQQYAPLPNSYPYYSGWPPYPPPYPSYTRPPSHLSLYSSSSHTQFASILDTASQTSLSDTFHDNTEPSIKDFLELLDKKYGEAKYTVYLQKFEEEEITVSQLAEMNPDVLLNELGIEITGRRLNIIKEAKNFF